MGILMLPVNLRRSLLALSATEISTSGFLQCTQKSFSFSIMLHCLQDMHLISRGIALGFCTESKQYAKMHRMHLR
jgi:hypothetical protein